MNWTTTYLTLKASVCLHTVQYWYYTTSAHLAILLCEVAMVVRLSVMENYKNWPPNSTVRKLCGVGVSDAVRLSSKFSCWSLYAYSEWPHSKVGQIACHHYFLHLIPPHIILWNDFFPHTMINTSSHTNTQSGSEFPQCKWSTRCESPQWYTNKSTHTLSVPFDNLPFYIVWSLRKSFTFSLVYTQVLTGVGNNSSKVTSHYQCAKTLLFLNLATPAILKMCLFTKQIKREVSQNKMMGRVSLERETKHNHSLQCSTGLGY